MPWWGSDGDARFEATGVDRGGSSNRRSHRLRVGNVHPLGARLCTDDSHASLVASRDVTVTGYVSDYSKTTGEGDVAALAVPSTPNADVGGQSVNPFAHLSNRDLTTRALTAVERARGTSGYGEVGDLREVDARERIVLGSAVDVVTYSSTATVEGEVTDARFVVASVEHGSDVVTVVGVHAAEFDATENLGALIERVEHDAARP